MMFISLVFGFSISLLHPTMTMAETHSKKECDDQQKIYKICSDQYHAFETAVKKANDSNKLILITFGADWCPWCKSMDLVLKSKQVWEKLEGKVIRFDVGVYRYDSREKIESGYKVLNELLQINQQKDSLFKGIPLLAVVNPKNKKTEFINSGQLEKNTKNQKGHDKAKVVEAILNATLNI